jgi:hypothetical protein
MGGIEAQCRAFLGATLVEREWSALPTVINGYEACWFLEPV